jgi:SNF2 family DNA or RNA helicase
MEEGTNKGGILADDMGLGKTISALALMLSRPSTDRLRKVSFELQNGVYVANFDRQL